MKPAHAFVLIAAAFGAAPTLAQKTPAAPQDLANPDSAFVANQTKGNWQAHITRSERGFVIGNPKAEASLIEFISYTCPHCATFTREGEPALDLALINPGKMKLEVRPYIRNPIDLVASLVVLCGDDKGLKNRHTLLMTTQNDWFEKGRQAPRSQQEMWYRGDAAARVNAASALGLVDMFAKGGQSRSELTACLMDDKAAAKLLDHTDADRAEFAVPGTPSFALDSKLIEDVHDWKALYPVLSSHFAATPTPAGSLPKRP
ncbi:MAG: thioredoxin domain-containing protein [Erythrobacter sp.]